MALPGRSFGSGADFSEIFRRSITTEFISCGQPRGSATSKTKASIYGSVGLLLRAFFLRSCVALSGCSASAVDHWPQFRGPNASGISEDATPPIHFGPEKNLLWKAAVPAGVSSPIVWGDRLFVTAQDDDKLLTLAFDAATGRELWRQVAPAEKLESYHAFSSAAAATPCTDGQRVYVYFNSFGVLAYDFAGKEVWRRPLPTLPVEYGSASSPVLVEGQLILLRDGSSTDSHLLALDSATGETLWDAARPLARDSHSTPMVWRHDGIKELMVQGRGRLSAYDPANGQMRWWVDGWGLPRLRRRWRARGCCLTARRGPVILARLRRRN